MMTAKRRYFAVIAACVTTLGCGTTRRDVARIDPQPGVTPQQQPGMIQTPATGVSQPFPAAQPHAQQPIAAVPAVSSAPVQQFVPQSVQPAAPQPPMVQPPNVSFGPSSTGSTFVPAGGQVAGPPHAGSPIPTTAPPGQAPIATTGTMVANPSAGFLSATVPAGLSFQPSQPQLPVYGPGQTVVPAQPQPSQQKQPSQPADPPAQPERMEAPEPPDFSKKNAESPAQIQQVGNSKQLDVDETAKPVDDPPTVTVPKLSDDEPADGDGPAKFTLPSLDD